jgi:hypothetical protein
MREFEVQISWTMVTTLTVRAETEEDAGQRVLNGMRPVDGEFVPFSMRVDGVEQMPAEQGYATAQRTLYRVK